MENNIMNKLNKNFDTALDSNAKATQHITEIRFVEHHNPFISKYLVEKAITGCEWMISQAKKKIQEFEAEIDKEFRNNPEQPSDAVINMQGSNIQIKEDQISEWLEERECLVKQLTITYPDWKPQAQASNGITKEQRNKLIAAAKKRAAKK